MTTINNKKNFFNLLSTHPQFWNTMSSKDKKKVSVTKLSELSFKILGDIEKMDYIPEKVKK
jgi:hypothetical protein